MMMHINIQSTFQICVAISFIIPVGHGQVVGPPGINEAFPASFPPSDRDPTQDDQACDHCQWTSPGGAFYDLSVVCQKKYSLRLESPRGAKLYFGVCQSIDCEGYTGQMSCIHVPGNPATSAGKKMLFEQIEPNVPAAGVRLTIHDGEICNANKKPRKTIIDFECQSSPSGVAREKEAVPTRGFEGEGTDICTYYVHFRTPYGCPARRNKYAPLNPKITAVSGCIDSIPKLSTSECQPGGGSEVLIHGTDFRGIDMEFSAITISFGKFSCTDIKVVSPWVIVCTLSSGTGENHGVGAQFKVKAELKKQPNSTPTQFVQELWVTSGMVTIAYKPLVDYKRHFDSFMDLGVGGLTKQIRELYQRAFASRSIPVNVLKKLGIEHAKGILLYGPPGSGKTLLARTIAKILKTDQVKLVNAPEIMSKYLGESEKNLRGYFEEAEKAWMELGQASDLYVIVIDEIDAICKPRGKSDGSAAAAAYDSVVNQLLTKMDGLKSLHNLLVIGMTNRPELIDAALLRPGRFEVQIEIGLPDKSGRWEIFYIHTSEMRENGYLGEDVDLHVLAGRTPQFSGAEIAGIVRLSASYALDRKYGNASHQEEPLKITQQDFMTALEQFKPAYTHREEDVVQEFLPHGFIKCGPPHDTIISEIVALSSLLEKNVHNGLETVLLYGPRGVGKSGLAAHVAKLVQFTFVKVVTPKMLLRYGTQGRIDTLIDTFHDAYKARFGVIILDEIHRLAELIQVGDKTEASLEMLHTLSTLLTTQPPPESKLLVLGTLWSEGEALVESYTGRVGLQHLFTTHHFVPTLQLAATYTALEHMGFRQSDGDLVAIPPEINVPLRTLLKVTDCIDLRLSEQHSSRSQTKQSFVQNCFQAYRLLR